MRIGEKFDKLTVEALVHKRSETSGKMFYEAVCRCDCGNEKRVRMDSLTTGTTKSCGCYRRAVIADRSTTHGQSKTPLHNVWGAMKERCAYKPGYAHISVCKEWEDSFETFRDYVIASLPPKPDRASLDRIDNNRGYEPGNIRWATPKQQARNRRVNTVLEFAGEKLCVAEWAERYGLKQETLLQRLKLGWSVEEAITTPVGVRSRWRKQTV